MVPDVADGPPERVQVPSVTVLPCSHGMPNAATCLDCMEDGPVATPSTWGRVGDRFRARFCGECPTCGSGFHEGDPIQRWDRDDRTVYTHERCHA